MKKIYFLLLIFCFFNSLNAQVINFPDANFKAKLLAANSSNTIASTQTPIYRASNGIWVVSSHHTIDTNNNGEIEVSEALTIKKLDVGGASISDLTGIEKFANLIYLNCRANQLTGLNVSSLINLKSLNCSSSQLPSLNISGLTNLQELHCDSNQLTSLSVLGLTNLRTLYCPNNQLYSLNVSGLNNLKEFSCNNNQLSSLNVSNLFNLQNLNCYSNRLPSLNVSGCVNLLKLECFFNELSSLSFLGCNNLQEINCNSNQLSSLNVSNLTKLQVLTCIDNQLTSLNVTGCTNLENLHCYQNQLVDLDLSGLTTLTDLQCLNNKLSSLNVSNLTNLTYLFCEYNQLTSLNVSDLTNMQVLSCQNNQLTSLFIKSNNLRWVTLDFQNNDNLKYVCADEEDVTLIQNKINQYGYSATCHVNAYCTFVPGGTFYKIQGSTRLDTNKNGCDALDTVYPNLKFSITDGKTTGNFISNASGDYSIPVQAGNHIITPVLENPTYFTISTTLVNVTFPTDASPFTQNFCVTPSGLHPDLEVSLLPITSAMPGFDATYKIIYKNKGNQVQSGLVNLTFDDMVLDFVSSTSETSSKSNNTISWDFTDLKPFESREIKITLNLNSPTETPRVINGDILVFIAKINSLVTDETFKDNEFTLNQTVVGSFDPNDKTCLEGAVITPSLIGENVHYLIRFENTGTYKAQNIVVKDMIDLSKFDISTLVPTSSSHSYITKISEGNKVEFVFENINLPFDDANNDGYIAFKIKTKPTLVVGDSFDNEANIYFDYNFPVLTNKATSKFATALETQDFEFSNYFKVYPIPADEVLNISAIQNIEIQSIAVYDILGQMVISLTNVKNTSIIDV
jgi:Leucine-rich repeat (LRR) protein